MAANFTGWSKTLKVLVNWYVGLLLHDLGAVDGAGGEL